VNVLALSTATTAALIAAGAALLGAMIGGGTTLLTASIQNSHEEAKRNAAAAAARRHRAAEILGRVRTWLADIEPERVGFNANQETTPELLRTLDARLATLRDELSIFAAGSDDDPVMDAAGKLEVALFNTFNRVRWHARDVLTRRGDMTSYYAARKEHDRPTIRVQIVLDLIRDRDVSGLKAQLDQLDEAPEGQ
jgi:hypothetical protein